MLSFGSPLSVEFRYDRLSWDLVRTILSVFYGYYVACTICTICLYYYSFYIKFMCYVVIREAFLYRP